jgi:Uncharacterized conserved protein (COG2071)
MLRSRLQATIERRLMVNYRADPEVVQRILPPGFRPQQANGYAVAGICLIRLTHLRPYGFPAFLGPSSEGAAHRIAVEWDTKAGTHTGVYVPRRDAGSLSHVVAGGRIYPGRHHRARFTTTESPTRLRLAYAAADGSIAVDVAAEPSMELEDSRLFADLAEASAFFESGSCAYSPQRDSTGFDGLRLHTDAWSIGATRVIDASSSFFDDRARFPKGTIELDSALLMRDVPVSWLPQASLRLADLAGTSGV